MNLLPVNVLCVVGIFVFLLIFAALIWLTNKYQTPICPKCGYRKYQKVEKLRIPGSEYAGHNSEYSGTIYYARYKVRYSCQRCGHQWALDQVYRI